MNGHRLASYYEARLLDIKQNVRDIFKEVENTVDIAEEIDVKGMQEKQEKCYNLKPVSSIYLFIVIPLILSSHSAG